MLSYYEENKDRPWHEWLEYDMTFPKVGKQGLTGLLRLKENKKKKCVFKVSQYINYLVDHEATVMTALNSIQRYCPHFCEMYGIITVDTDPKNRKTGNPFELSETKHPIKKDVLISEYIDDGMKMYAHIKDLKHTDDEVIYSSIKQVLMALAVAQREVQFAHYDLHSDNILLRRCNPNRVHLYVLDDDNQFLVPTYGYYPAIIDFGFSYAKTMDDGPAWCSMAHTNAGYMSDRMDWVSDPKLFLVTVSSELESRRDNHNSTKLRNIVMNIFADLDIDWDAGWDLSDHDAGAMYHILDKTNRFNSESKLFGEHDHYCFDIIQTLVKLPFEKQSSQHVHLAFKTFLHEFVKIENEITSSFYNLYILKGIVDSARNVRSQYMNNDDRKDAVNRFTNDIFETIQEVAKFCRPKNLHYEKMLCSLYMLGDCCEGILFDAIDKHMKRKQKQYAKMPVTSIEQIFGIIDINFEDDYVFDSDKTEIVVYDCIKKKTTNLYLDEDMSSMLNSCSYLSRGSELYEALHRRKSRDSYTR